MEKKKRNEKGQGLPGRAKISVGLGLQPADVDATSYEIKDSKIVICGSRWCIHDLEQY